MHKPKILVLGGCGFIGRNLVCHLVTRDLVDSVRIVDKVPPQIAWLNENHFTAINNPKVEFKSANLINFESCKASFAVEGSSWDVVINCAGETRLGQVDPIYQEGILKLSINCAKLAAQYNTVYIELSSGNMFSSEKVPHTEDGALDPWTAVAKWKKQVEKELSEIHNLKYTILRLPRVYGLGDKQGLMPRIIGAAIYKSLGEPMKLLWSSSLKLNTVHVEDVCNAIWLVINKEEARGQIYNVVDNADSTQGSISNLLKDLFNIKIDYYGNLASAMVDLNTAVEEANDKHLEAWAKACAVNNIQNTPLSPHIDVEVLVHKHLHLDNRKIKALGLKLQYLQPTTDLLKAIINDYIEMNIFPASLAP